MAQNTANTIEVEHDGETIAVPTEFGVNDVATYFGVNEWPITVDRVFLWDGFVRAESFGGEQYVEVAYCPDGGHSDTHDTGWIADALGSVDPAEVRERGVHNLGETLWVRDG